MYNFDYSLLTLISNIPNCGFGKQLRNHCLILLHGTFIPHRNVVRAPIMIMIT